MQHAIPVDPSDPATATMTHAIERCVHCGFCLPACPTYQALGEEMDSPRGRIFLMKEVLEGRVRWDEAMPYIDRCLGCVGCVPACPSGVPYGELITPFRGLAEQHRTRTWMSSALRRLVLETLPYPGRFRLAVRWGNRIKLLQRLLPRPLRVLFDLLPAELPEQRPLPSTFAAEGPRRARVALLAGCAQQVLAPDINWATCRVLARNGVEVVIPQQQVCCGALAAHTGVLAQAKQFARQNLRAFPADVDAILTNAAGCGSGMHEYGLWLQGEHEQQAAETFADRVKDVSVFLRELGPIELPALTAPLRLAYHDACHLAHAQGVKQAPRDLLTSIRGLELLEIPGGEMCCGSAGTYNIEQPETANQLGQQKAAAIVGTRAEGVATGNIGCLTQIQLHLKRMHRELPVLHTMQILDRVYQQAPLMREPSGT